MSATVAVIAATSANNAAMAASAAARRAECRKALDAYDAQSATVEQARDYASCVRTIHGTGEPLDPASAILVKLAIVLAFAGAAAGGIWTWRTEGDPVFTVAGTFMGAILFPCALGVVLLAMAGLGFLFS